LLSFVVSGVHVSVRFFATLREVTGKREETLKFKDGEAVTIKMVIEALGKRYGKSFVEYVYDRKTGEVKGFLQFLVNGRSTPTSEGLNVKLADGDVLAIIPPVGGG
jgi:MoaD family protein